MRATDMLFNRTAFLFKSHVLIKLSSLFESNLIPKK